MPNTYRVHDDGSIVLERWTGTITHAELIEHEKAQSADPAIREGAVVLADCTGASFESTSENIHELTDVLAPDGHMALFRKIALLVGDDTLELAELFSRQLDERGVAVVVFVSLDVTCAWLGTDPDTTRARLQELSA